MSERQTYNFNIYVEVESTEDEVGQLREDIFKQIDHDDLTGLRSSVVKDGPMNPPKNGQ